MSSRHHFTRNEFAFAFPWVDLSEYFSEGNWNIMYARSWLYNGVCSRRVAVFLFHSLTLRRARAIQLPMFWARFRWNWTSKWPNYPVEEWFKQKNSLCHLPPHHWHIFHPTPSLESAFFYLCCCVLFSVVHPTISQWKTACLHHAQALLYAFNIKAIPWSCGCVNDINAFSNSGINNLTLRAMLNAAPSSLSMILKSVPVTPMLNFPAISEKNPSERYFKPIACPLEPAWHHIFLLQETKLPGSRIIATTRARLCKTRLS